jgi:hypothetical protein
MKCSTCGTVAENVPQNRAVRCLTCGGLLNLSSLSIQPPPISTVGRHSYTTPFGKLRAQVQKSGDWIAISYVAVPVDRKSTAATLISTLLNSWSKLSHPSLPKLHSFNSKELRCTWVLPKIKHATPLAASRSHLRPDQVKILVHTLAAQMEHLHQAGLAAFDLSPSVIFLPAEPQQACFIPTLWLASQAIWSPGQIKDMPFVAAELDQALQTYPDAVRADLNALGNLAFLLLTGMERKKGQVLLPSEHSAKLESWDRFIDGCCRANPSRRFDSVAVALRALDDGQQAHHDQIPLCDNGPVASAISPGQASIRKRENDATVASLATTGKIISRIRRRLAVAVGLVIVPVLVLVVYLLREQIASFMPLAGGFLVPYQRGFGDTILKYKDRSYENASWKKLKETESLAEVASLGRTGTAEPLHRVIGWDDESFSVLLERGRVLQFRDGHWFSAGKPNHAREPSARLLDKDNLLVAGGCDSPRHLYQLTPKGIVDHGKLDFSNCSAGTEICPIAPDLFYCFSREMPHLNGMGTLKIADGKRTEMPEHKYKEAWVHRDDNTPLREYPVRGIRHTRALAAGKAFGIACNGFDSESSPKLVSFNNGIWYVVDDLQHKENLIITDAWVGVNGDTAKFVIYVGSAGHVYSHTLNGPKVEQRVTPPQEASSLALIKVWGVSPEKFWVMDRSGTVWERQKNDWRVVVRGMYRDDVAFVDAWVSPGGTVIAITEKFVYRLD